MQAMEYISLVDTSLDLNSNPRRLIEEVAPKKEMHSDFIEFGRQLSGKEETVALVDELNRVNQENKKLTEMLTVLCENYNALRKQMIDYISKHPATDKENINSKKRKAESPRTNNGGSSESSSSEENSFKKQAKEEVTNTKTSRVYFRTESSDTSLVVKDGYQWRKYGQKVTRDNPSPRAYFKCSFAPSCSVKKKVQRSVEDQSVLVATYEGEHNHPQPSTTDGLSCSSRGMALGSVPCSTSLTSSGPTITLDLTKTNSMTDVKNLMSTEGTKSPEFQKFLVEQMASSLSNDAGFKASLARALSGRFLHYNA